LKFIFNKKKQRALMIFKKLQKKNRPP